MIPTSNNLNSASLIHQSEAPLISRDDSSQDLQSVANILQNLRNNHTGYDNASSSTKFVDGDQSPLLSSATIPVTLPHRSSIPPKPIKKKIYNPKRERPNSLFNDLLFASNSSSSSHTQVSSVHPQLPIATLSIPQKIDVIINFINCMHEITKNENCSKDGKILLDNLNTLDEKLPEMLKLVEQIKEELTRSVSSSSEYEDHRFKQKKDITNLENLFTSILKYLNEPRIGHNLLSATNQGNLIFLINAFYQRADFIKTSFNVEPKRSTTPIAPPLLKRHRSNDQDASNDADSNNEVEPTHKKRKVSINTVIYHNPLAILEIYKKLLNDQESADVVFKFDEGELYAHRSFLYYRCSKLLQLELADFKETQKTLVIKIDRFSIEIFKEILSSLYIGKINLNLENVYSIYRAADHYNLNRLKSLCKDYFTQELSNQNAIDFLIKAHHEQIDCIYQEILAFVLGNAQTLFHQECIDFLKLPKDVFLNILESDHFNLPEIEILKVAVRWIEAQETAVDLSEVKENIRFTHIPNKAIWDFVENLQIKQQPLCSVEELIEISKKIARKEYAPPRNLKHLWILPLCSKDYLGDCLVKTCESGETIISWKIVAQTNSFISRTIEEIPGFTFNLGLSYKENFTIQPYIQLQQKSNSANCYKIGIDFLFIHKDARHSKLTDSFSTITQFFQEGQQTHVYQGSDQIDMLRSTSGFNHNGVLHLQVKIKCELTTINESNLKHLRK